MMLRFRRLGVSLLIAVLFTSCSSSNKFMSKETPEFEKVTINFIGKWAVNSFETGKLNLLERPYEKAAMTFDFGSRKATMNLWVSDAILGEKMADWKQKWHDLKVDSYKIILSADWRLSKKGEILYLENQVVNLDIRGSGENFESFYNWEKSKFESSKATSNQGGLAGLAMGKLVKTATGSSDLFPKLSEQYNFRFDSNNKSVRLYGLSKNQMIMNKID